MPQKEGFTGSGAAATPSSSVSSHRSKLFHLMEKQHRCWWETPLLPWASGPRISETPRTAVCPGRALRPLSVPGRGDPRIHTCPGHLSHSQRRKGFMSQCLLSKEQRARRGWKGDSAAVRARGLLCTTKSVWQPHRGHGHWAIDTGGSSSPSSLREKLPMRTCSHPLFLGSRRL